MEDINIILHNSITSFEVNLMSICLSIASCKPEKPTSTNNRHLSDAGKHIVSPQNAKGATIILPFCENKVQRHQKTKFTLWCRCINPLCSSYKLWADLGLYGQRVIHHCDQPKWWEGFLSNGCSDNWNSSWVSSTDYVMEVEVKVA